jgi:GNAT superfamily N-acetyltransferase
MTDLTFRTFIHSDVGGIRQTLLAVYAEVYRERLDEPFFTLAEFDDRLSGYAAAPGWECVVGFDNDNPVGYAFGYTLQPGARWWSGLSVDVDPSITYETGERTFALNELMVREPWRGTGAARRIHDELVSHRREERVTLLVEATHPRVRRIYEAWGYVFLAQIRPDLPDAPVLEAMLLPLRAGTAPHS